VQSVEYVCRSQGGFFPRAWARTAAGMIATLQELPIARKKNGKWSRHMLKNTAERKRRPPYSGRDNEDACWNSHWNGSRES
jgi:hypothetical protein